MTWIMVQSLLCCKNRTQCGDLDRFATCMCLCFSLSILSVCSVKVLIFAGGKMLQTDNYRAVVPIILVSVTLQIYCVYPVDSPEEKASGVRAISSSPDIE